MENGLCLKCIYFCKFEFNVDFYDCYLGSTMITHSPVFRLVVTRTFGNNHIHARILSHFVTTNLKTDVERFPRCLTLTVTRICAVTVRGAAFACNV